MDPLMDAVKRTRWRLAAGQGLEALSRGLLLGAGTSCAWLIATRFFPMLGAPEGVAAGLMIAAVLGALGWAWWQFPSVEGSALALDQRLHLRERVTSSMALAAAEGEMVQALHRDAREALRGTRVVDAFPVRLPYSARWVAVPLVFFGLAYVLLPEFDLLHYRTRQAAALAKAAKQEESAKALEGAAKLLKKEDAPARGELAAVAEKLELTAGDLRAGQIGEKQALAKVSDALEDLAKQQQALKASRPAEMRGLQDIEHPDLKKIAEDLKNGKPLDAAQKLRAVEEKLKDPKLSDAEKKKLEEGLRALQSALRREGTGEKSSEQSSASADKKAGNGKTNSPGQGEPDSKAGEGGEQMELSVEDLASSLEQMGKLQQAAVKLNQWKNTELGPSKFCRSCGKKLGACKKPGHCKGECEDGECSGMCSGCMGKGAWRAGEGGQGNGMGGPGQGRGSEVGPLPKDVAVNFQPTTLPGQQTKGKILTEITERTAPVPDGETSQITAMQGNFEAVQQQAEEALEHEEIPAGAKEFVRQYFGATDASKDAH